MPSYLECQTSYFPRETGRGGFRERCNETSWQADVSISSGWTRIVIELISFISYLFSRVLPIQFCFSFSHTYKCVRKSKKTDEANLLSTASCCHFLTLHSFNSLSNFWSHRFWFKKRGNCLTCPVAIKSSSSDETAVVVWSFRPDCLGIRQIC